jgi:hypothetical protein
VAGLLADRAAGSVREGLVAVVGMLASDPRAARCPDSDPGLATSFCHRSSTLAPAPDPLEGGTNLFATTPGPGVPPDGSSGMRLYPRIPAGIPMPAMFAADPPPGAPGQALLSVVIGRFTSPEPPACPDRSPCRDDFVVERLAWAAGSWIDRILVRDPALPEAAIPSTGRRPLAIASREADRVEQILSLAIVRPDWLLAFDRPIGDAAAAGASAFSLGSGPVWYVRSVGHPSAMERQLTWAVIDHQSGLVLASGAIGGA